MVLMSWFCFWRRSLSSVGVRPGSAELGLITWIPEGERDGGIVWFIKDEVGLSDVTVLVAASINVRDLKLCLVVGILLG